jgi:hypothetical protein
VGERADRTIEAAVGADGPVALFAHGHILRILAARWVGLPPVAGRSLGPFRFVEDLSQRAFRLIGDHALLWGLGLGAVILTAVLTVTLRRPPREEPGEVLAEHGMR